MGFMLFLKKRHSSSDKRLSHATGAQEYKKSVNTPQPSSQLRLYHEDHLLNNMLEQGKYKYRFKRNRYDSTTVKTMSTVLVSD